MKVIHLLAGGGIGGIEILLKDYAHYSKNENVMVILWGDGSIAEEMQKLGTKVIRLHASKKNFIATIHKVIKVCKEERADVIIAHHAAPLSHLCLLYAKWKNKQIHTIAYAHSNAVNMVRSKDKNGLWIRKAILQISLKHADQIIAISNSVKNSLITYFGISEEKISVIYNGVDLSQYNITSRKGNKNKLNIIYVGRLLDAKGIQVTLKAFSRIKNKDMYHLKVVGDGPYRAELEKMVQEFGIGNYIEFLGSRRDIPQLLEQADVFVHVPIDEEGFGITIIEAMAAGLICICSKSGAIPEIITDGKDGFIIQKNNFIQLKEALEQVYNLTGEERKQIRINAYERVQNFSMASFTKQLDELLKTFK